MAVPFAESDIEAAALGWLADLGYAVLRGRDIAPDSRSPERTLYGAVILSARLTGAIDRLNPHLPPAVREEARRQIDQVDYPDLIAENRRRHRFMVEGVPVDIRGADDQLTGDYVRLLDFETPDNNDWLAVNQVTVIENGVSRRPDIVLFVNGLPVVVIELKRAGAETATLDNAFNQLQTYKQQIGSLFRTNAALVISDGITARIGSLTAGRERFMPWRAQADGRPADPAAADLKTLLTGAFDKRCLLQLLRDFTVFGDSGDDIVKIIAGYHQVRAVRQAVARTLEATAPAGDRRVGVIWHTQGAGKSLLMAFYAGQIIRQAALANPTLIVLTDRNDLDDQLLGTFTLCRDLLRQLPEQAADRADLRRRLDRVAGGVIFTTLQKFLPKDDEEAIEPVTRRRNVVVIVDEAHRSQYGFNARIDKKTGTISYGFARYMRDSLPNASFIGFTGTPIEGDDVNTPLVFGGYIDIYDISRAVEDKATVPIYYESRLARIDLPDDLKPALDADMAALTDDVSEGESERLNRRFSSVEAVVGADQRLALVAADLVDHVDARVAALDGKAMVVCMSRRICVALYDALIRLRPHWHSDCDDAGAVKIVMTGSASDPVDWQRHIGPRPKARRDRMAQRIKDPADPLTLVLVRDMWLTGFDAPCLHTLYVDKPMRGHGLMQAIARVNRVFRDKPAGLVVDYIGIAQNLKQALTAYSDSDRSTTGINEAEALAVFIEKYEIVRDMFRPDGRDGFDYRAALAADATPGDRLSVMAGALQWILAMQQADAAKEQDEAAKKRAHRRFPDAVLALSKAYVLIAGRDAGKDHGDEVGFFQAIRAALVKSTASGSSSRRSADRDLAIRQLVSRAVVSTGIVDILRAAGIKTPDISILSDDFLAEMRHLDKKNLALEALRKLINGDIRSRSHQNVTQSRAFSERLDAAVARYHTNALTTVQVLEELIDLARDIRAARQRSEETGLSEDEIAFYDALADNQSARDLMGEPALRVIAHELMQTIKENVTADWTHRESARADIRRRVKRILRKYGYPPDLQDAAVQNVLHQAEARSARVGQP